MALQDVIPIPPEEKPRKTGIKAVGAVPWGMHLCSFYDTEQDLIDILVPYFKAGLENNESCIWVTSEPLVKKEAEEAMRKAVPDFAQYLGRGQIEIVPHTEWYLKGGTFNRQRVLNAWIDKLNQALVRGYDGMRITGNTAWLEEKDWADFTDYEEEINNVIGKYRMLAICTYSLDKCGVSEVIDVMSHHQFALNRQGADWVLTEHGEALREYEEKYRNLFQLSPVGVTTLDLKGVITSCNPAVYNVGGYTEDELVGRHFTKIAPVRLRDIPKFVGVFGSVIIGKIPKPFVVTYNRKDGTTGWTEVHVALLKEGVRKLGLQVLQRDITDQKRGEEKLRASHDYLELLTDSMVDAVFSVKMPERVIEWVNHSFRLIGYKPEECIGKTTEFLYPDKEGFLAFGNKLKRAIAKGKDVLHTEQLLKRRNGEVFPAEVTVSFFKEKGEIVRVTSIVRDITERKQAGDNPGKTSDEDRSKEQARLASLQARFIRSGFESFDDHEIIELLLSLVLPPRKCERLAKACIEQFGGLREFLSASTQELQRAGLTPSCIFSVRLLHELPEEVLKQKILEKPVYKSSEEVFDYLRYSMRDLKIEVFKVIYLNKRNEIIDTVDLFEGTLDSIPIRPREIMESAIAHNATGLIFAHNHPTGDPAPSRTDKQLTRELVFVGLIMQIKVLDHIIIGEDRYFSFADEKLIEKYEDDFLNLKMKALFEAERVHG